MALVAAPALAGLFGSPGLASAQDRALADLPAVHAACRAADDEGIHDRLYSILLDGVARFTAREGDEEGEVLYTLPDARSLRAMGGSVQLVPAHLEPIAFVANQERARALEAARDHGARVRVGFFLGFDEPERRACLVRASQAVTALRIDVAFVELVEADGSVVAREDHDRLRAWSDDANRTASQEPEASVGLPTTDGSSAPEPWARALRAAGLARQLVACHVAGVAQGAAREAMVQVRLRVDARAGRVEDAVIEVGNVGNDDENTCVLAALRAVSLAAAANVAGHLDLRVPVHLRAP
jgi:hypothetical protein